MCAERSTLETALSMSLKVIRMHDWLLDLYVLDYFVDDHWSKLPVSWRKCFENMTPQDLGNILSGYPTNHMLPLNFIALVNTIKALSIPRQKNSSDTKTRVYSEDSCGGHAKLKNLFLKHVKLKKRHEISLMADVVSDIAADSKCNAVVDFGSGLGHLVRVLAFKNDLYSAGIECQSQLTEEARKLDLELEYTASKQLSKQKILNLKRPIHFNMTLNSYIHLQQLDFPETMKTYGLVGLHPCGDLGPLLLKHFVHNEQVKYICVVGCCFMKLSCDGEEKGYPLSRYVQSLDSRLSYVSREIACHAIEIYMERLRNNNYDDLKVHAYRAALEWILVEHDPKLKHAPVRSIKHCNTMTFEDYCMRASSRLSSALPPSARARGAAALGQWRRVATLYTLRLALAPLVETVVLLDRMLYLLEHGMLCEIRPVFDPKLSPRNHIIIGRR